MQFPITIGLHRSRFLDAGVLLVASLASAAIFSFPRSTAIQWLIFGFVCLLAGLAWWRLSPSLSAIRLEGNGELWVALAGQNEFSLARILPVVTVHPWLTVVGLSAGNGVTHALIVTVDSLASPDFRRLRVFLRWRANLNVTDDDV